MCENEILKEIYDIQQVMKNFPLFRLSYVRHLIGNKEEQINFILLVRNFFELLDDMEVTDEKLINMYHDISRNMIEYCDLLIYNINNKEKKEGI